MSNGKPDDIRLASDASPPQKSGMDVMSCEQAGRQIERLVEDSELKEIERTLLFAHVRVCAPCKAELQRRRTMEVRLKEAFSAIDTRSDFNAKLMAALPDIEYGVLANDDNNFDSKSTLRRVSARALHAAPRIFQRWRLPVAVAAMVCIGLMGLALRSNLVTLRSSDKPPSVVRLSGRVLITRRGAPPEAPFSEHMLIPGEVIEVDGGEATVRLQFAEKLLAEVTLQSGAELTAVNRHSYSLRAGSAHFEVNHDRPQEADEDFEVHIGNDAVVRVKGTKFDIKNVGGNAIVSVETGHVQVQSDKQATSDKLVDLHDGEQVTLGPGGFVSAVVAVQKQVEVPRLNPRPHSPDVVAEKAPNIPVLPNVVELSKTPATGPAGAATPDDAREFDWNASVAPLATADLPLADGITALAGRMGDARPLLDLAQQARSLLVAAENRLSFSIRHPMPLRAALAWMARDVGLRLEFDGKGRAQFRVAVPDELSGTVEPGALPDNIQKLLELPERNARFASGRALTLAAALDVASAASGITMIADREAVGDTLYSPDTEPLAQTTGARRLDSILARARLCAIWFDNALYVSRANKLEAMTTLERSSKPVSVLIGIPERPEWSRSLSAIPAEHWRR